MIVNDHFQWFNNHIIKAELSWSLSLSIDHIDEFLVFVCVCVYLIIIITLGVIYDDYCFCMFLFDWILGMHTFSTERCQLSMRFWVPKAGRGGSRAPCWRGCHAVPSLHLQSHTWGWMSEHTISWYIVIK